MKARLSVNIDHVATVRQARRAAYPDPVEAALIAEAAGASGITAHLRGDRRHVQDPDLTRLKGAIRGKLNVEMAATDEMLDFARALFPHQVTLVPERPEEVTTEGGLDLLAQGARVGAAALRLAGHGIAVSVFLDPDPRQLAALIALGPGAISGFELNTDAYTRADGLDRELHLAGLRAAAEEGHAAGFRVYAGHGLTTDNVGPVAALPFMEELNIGHFLVARAVMVGMREAVREMLAAMAG
ncbi:MAG TPA: pyridoxine 5'-phosphate synthase [Thermoanaerobaculia bacterium]|jgi:pyridoxine 5-phosphate synthase|nr:pyridoxine 5'-phosphate synthase [Thermoanaerobaculia bacterium]